MAILRAFRGFRPKKNLAARIASRPYDVLNSEEAREIVKGNPYSFLRVVKPEVDLLPEQTCMQRRYIRKDYQIWKR